MELNKLFIDAYVMDDNMPAKVTGISNDGIIETTLNKRSNIELIKPIQITPEILEKNGFSKKHPLQHYCELKTPKYSILVRFTISNKVDYVRYSENNRHFPAEAQSFRLNDIQYVHQLQQALHLCGIEKEIIIL